jgi:RimJ/RimL family protein N-acetyltransferase
LRTDRLLLRPFTSSDAEAVYLACQDPDIQFYTPAPSPYRRADAEKFVNESAPMGWSTDTEYIFGGFRDDDGAFVGTYLMTRRDQGVYEIGYWAAKEQRGLGYSFEASKALCDWSFATLEVHRLEWWAMVGNAASLALAEKLGFTVEGTLRRRAIVNGEPRDWWVGGLLRTEWDQPRPR